MELFDRATLEVERLDGDRILALAVPLGFSESLRTVALPSWAPTIWDGCPSRRRAAVDDPLSVGRDDLTYDVVSWRDERSRAHGWEFINTLWVRARTI